MFSQVIYQLRLPGDRKFFTFKCSVNITIKKKKMKYIQKQPLRRVSQLQIIVIMKYVFTFMVASVKKPRLLKLILSSNVPCNIT